MSVSEFQQDSRICPVTCLRGYLSCTQAWREEQSQLFLAITALHKPVTSSSIAIWLKDVLHQSGVDISCFAAHSTRGASALAAALSGTTTATIIERAGWSQRSTFSIFYHKHTTHENVAAQLSRAVLKGKGYKYAY